MTFQKGNVMKKDQDLGLRLKKYEETVNNQM